MKTIKQKMTRFDLLMALAAYSHPEWYHCLTEWPTHELEHLLAYYKGESSEMPRGEMYRSKRMGDEPNPRAHKAYKVIVKIPEGHELVSFDGKVLVTKPTRRPPSTRLRRWLRGERQSTSALKRS